MNRSNAPQQDVTQNNGNYPDFLTALAMHDRQVIKFLSQYPQLCADDTRAGQDDLDTRP